MLEGDRLNRALSLAVQIWNSVPCLVPLTVTLAHLLSVPCMPRLTTGERHQRHVLGPDLGAGVWGWRFWSTRCCHCFQWMESNDASILSDHRDLGLPGAVDELCRERLGFLSLPASLHHLQSWRWIQHLYISVGEWSGLGTPCCLPLILYVYNQLLSL